MTTVRTEAKSAEARPLLRLFCFPPAGAGATFFHSWKHLVPRQIAVEPLELPGRGARFREPLVRNVADLASDLALTIEAADDVPCAFFGHSFGALLAFEVATRLREPARRPLVIFLSACPAPHRIPERQKLHRLPDQDLVHVLERLNGTARDLLASTEFMSLLLPILRADLEAFECYDVGSGHISEINLVLMCGTRDNEISLMEMKSWQAYFDRACVLQPLPGDHFYLTENPSAIINSIFKRVSAHLPR